MDEPSVELRELKLELLKRANVGKVVPELAWELAWELRSLPVYPPPPDSAAVPLNWVIEQQGRLPYTADWLRALRAQRADLDAWLTDVGCFGRVAIYSSAVTKLDLLGRPEFGVPILLRSSAQRDPGRRGHPLVRLPFTIAGRGVGAAMRNDPEIGRGLVRIVDESQLGRRSSAFVHLGAQDVPGSSPAVHCAVLFVHDRALDLVELLVQRELRGALACINVDSDRIDIARFYRYLLSGWPLDRAVVAADTKRGRRTPMFVMDEGVELLFAPLRVIAESRRYRSRSRLLARAREKPQSWTRSGSLPTNMSPLLKGNELRSGREWTIDFDETRSGLEATSDDSESSEGPIFPADFEPDARLTKASFLCAGEPLDEPVEIDAALQLRVTIAAPDDDAPAGLTTPLPERVLRELLDDAVQETPIAVRLFVLSEDWDAPERELVLMLPRFGPAREGVEFELRPRRVGILPARVGLYAADILLQSFSARVPIRSAEFEPELSAPSWELDYVASADFELLDELEQRRPALSLFINRSDTSHWIGAVGAQLSATTLALDTSDALKLIEPTREHLEQTHLDFANKADRDHLHRQLVELACRGRDLHCAAFRGMSPPIREFLFESQRVAIARIDMQAPQLPWSLLYDYDLDSSDSTSLAICPEAGSRRDLKPGESVPCVSDQACRDRLAQRGHVCPYGFWGLRHRMEVNLGHRKLETLSPTALSLLGEQVIAASEIRYAFSTLVDESADHADALTEAGRPLQLRSTDDGKQIRSLLRAPQEQVLYLLCHGRFRDPGNIFYLEFVANEELVQLSPTELAPSMFDVPGDDQPFLVILNACESAAVGPTTVHGVFDAMRQNGAVAIVGTEVEVKRGFALEFGPALVRGLVEGNSLSDLIYSLRWAHFGRDLDPSGLVYTAYGPGSLRLLAAGRQRGH